MKTSTNLLPIPRLARQFQLVGITTATIGKGQTTRWALRLYRTPSSVTIKTIFTTGDWVSCWVTAGWPTDAKIFWSGITTRMFGAGFEALFILTIIAAGTRVGRFMLQDLLGPAFPSLKRSNWMPGVFATSGVVVLAWGYFLYQGVRDPLGGINSLWPLFGIANQLLAAIALCVGTTIFIKMHRARYMWITAVPLSWLVIVTFTAGYQKIFSSQPRLGFLSDASHLQSAIDTGAIAAGKIGEAQGQIFNDRLDAVVCGMFLIMVALILVDSVRVWWRILSGSPEVKVDETPFVLSELQTEEL